MTESQFLEKAKARYEELQSLNKLDSFFDYEISMSVLHTRTG